MPGMPPPRLVKGVWKRGYWKPVVVKPGRAWVAGHWSPAGVWVPGFWVEYGMAAEPSAFGARIRFHHDGPPAIEPVTTDPTLWADAPVANPQEDGFTPLTLRLYKHAEERLRAETDLLA